MKAEWLDTDSDEAALEEVRRRRHSLTCELWERQRLVGTIAPYRA